MVFSLGSTLSALLLLMPAVSKAVVESEIVYVEQFSENKYVVEVREVGSDGWPKLKRSLVLNSQNISEKNALKDFIQRSTSAPHPASGSSRTLKPSTPVPLWQIKNSWSEIWEQKYSEWIARELDVDFFERHQIATDCADIVYAARWIFSRIHQLPAAFNLAGTNTVFTHQSVRSDWVQLPTDPLWSNDQKFLASLNYLLEQTNTETLRTAGYPIAINARSLKAGIYRVRTNSGGSSRHTYLYNRFSGPPTNEYPISNLQSTMPREVRKLNASTFDPDEKYTDPNEGLQRLRWAVLNGATVQILAQDKHPSFSQEQFDPQVIPQDQWAMKILQTVNPNFDKSWMSKVAGDTMVQNIVARVRIVEEGFAFCQKNDCSPGSEFYEDWSTPVRDGRTLDYYQTYSEYASDEQLSQSVMIQGQAYPIQFIYWAWRNLGPGSHDPRDPIETRWGFFSARIIERIKNILQTESAKRLTLLQTKAVDSQERRAIDAGIQFAIRTWIYPYVFQAYSNIPVRALTSEILKGITTQTLSINGIERSLRHWIAFFSAAASESLGEDPWGESLGTDWRVGVIGENVYAVDTQKNMTLTEFFLIDERTYSFVSLDGITGPIQIVDEKKHVIAIGNKIFDWDSNSKFECTKKNDKITIVGIYNSDFILCGDEVLQNTPSGFQIFKTGFSTAVGMRFEGLRRLATGISLTNFTSDTGSFVSEDGTVLQFNGISALNASFRTKNHLILQRGPTWAALGMKSRSVVEFSSVFHQPERLHVFANPFSDIVLVQDGNGKLWRLDLQNAPLGPQLLHVGRVAGANSLATSTFIQHRAVGHTFGFEPDPTLPPAPLPYFSFLWGRNQTFAFSHGASEIPRAIVPTRNGFQYCSNQASYRLDSNGLALTYPDRCRIDLKHSAISKERTDSTYVKRSLTSSALLPHFLPDMDPVESWNLDYVPIKRTLDFAEGVIWIKK